MSPDCKKQDLHRFEDRSIYKYGLTYVAQQENLGKFISDQTTNGNLIAFPEKEFQVCLVLNREDKAHKHFLLRDIFTERCQRKIFKQESMLTRAPGEDSDAFEIDADGKVLIYVSGEDLVLQYLKIADPLHKHIRPRYNLALHKENPAKIAQ